MIIQPSLLGVLETGTLMEGLLVEVACVNDDCSVTPIVVGPKNLLAPVIVNVRLLRESHF